MQAIMGMHEAEATLVSNYPLTCCLELTTTFIIMAVLSNVADCIRCTNCIKLMRGQLLKSEHKFQHQLQRLSFEQK